MSDEARFARLALEGRAMVRRMVEDWPYQPPEVIGPEREAFRRWVAEEDFSGAHMLAISEEARA
jgi:hypothetical protein